MVFGCMGAAYIGWMIGANAFPRSSVSRWTMTYSAGLYIYGTALLIRRLIWLDQAAGESRLVEGESSGPTPNERCIWRAFANEWRWHDAPHSTRQRSPLRQNVRPQSIAVKGEA